MKKLTKIVATISDINCEVDFLERLYKAGMNAVRFNTAHQTPENTLKAVRNVKQVSNKIPMLLDTKGPEIRTSKGDDIRVNKDDLINISGEPGGHSRNRNLYVTYKDIAKDIETGGKILIDDGDISLTVVEKHPSYLVCKTENSGIIEPRKSVNLPGIPVRLPALSDKDREYIDFAIRHDIDFIAHSFVRSSEDVMEIQKILDRHNSKIKIIAKIENQQGINNIDEILKNVYGIMVARGDLAIEIPAEKIPVIQRNLVKKCMRNKKAVIIATQVLHSMIKNPRPTRAEVTDIANAVFTGTDAIMLSGETAYGKYPVEAVQMMTKTIIEAEANIPFIREHKVLPHDNEISVFLSKTAVNAYDKLKTKAIITDTDTGKTARYLAAFRGPVPIYAQSYEKRVMRELGLIFGVLADYMDVETSKKDFIRATLNNLLEIKEVRYNDLIALLAGNFGKKAGPSFVEISTVKNMLS